MTELVGRIKALTALELREANAEHPQFASAHEGYAVLMEEIEEAAEALEEMRAMQKILWRHIRGDNAMMAKSFAGRAGAAAAELAAEAVQCAAMAQKLIDCIDS